MCVFVCLFCLIACFGVSLQPPFTVKHRFGADGAFEITLRSAIPEQFAVQGLKLTIHVGDNVVEVQAVASEAAATGPQRVSRPSAGGIASGGIGSATAGAGGGGGPAGSAAAGLANAALGIGGGRLTDVRYDATARQLRWTIGACPARSAFTLSGRLRPRTVGADVLRPPPTLQLEFSVDGYSLSGVQVDKVTVSNVQYTPFKGLRFVGKSGRYFIRTGGK